MTGKLKKFDVLTGETDWEVPDQYPNWGGTLVTDGGLVFYGSLGGDFRAVDRKSGKVLWSRKLGSGMIANPITYKIKGKQYVSILTGIGGWIGVPVTAGLDLNDKFGAIGATAMTKAANLDKIRAGRLALHLPRDGLIPKGREPALKMWRPGPPGPGRQITKSKKQARPPPVRGRLRGT